MKWMKDDKIRIKPYYEIHEIYTGLLFLPIMKPFCGMTLTLHRQTITPRVWRINDIGWLWHENWFEAPDTFLSDKDFEI